MVDPYTDPANFLGYQVTGVSSPSVLPTGTPQPTTAPVKVNINDPQIAGDVNSLQSAEAQAHYLQRVYEAQKNYINAFNTPTPTPTPAPNQSQVLGASTSQYQPTTDAQYEYYLQNLLDSQNDLATYQASQAGQPTAQTSQTQTYTPSQPNYSSVPSNYTGFFNGNPYVGGTVQTSGGGFTPEGSYSAGYHGGGGPPVDMGQWGTGPNMGPMVNGTVQTGGGQFTPEGSYSAGYHGSGEHPEITGESTPGQYQSGSFGSVANPDFSNGGKVKDFINYVSQMGYDTSKVDRIDLERQYNKNGGKFDGISFLKTLPQANQNKTDLLSQMAANPMMPTEQMYALFGGMGFPGLFAQQGIPPGFPRIGGGFFNIGQPAPPNQTIISNVKPAPLKSMKDLPGAVEQLYSSYVNPYAGGYTSEDELEKLKLI